MNRTAAARESWSRTKELTDLDQSGENKRVRGDSVQFLIQNDRRCVTRNWRAFHHIRTAAILIQRHYECSK
jgi:hypothetical protein